MAFGTLFNNIQIKHKDNAGDDFSIITVPIAYGPVQKFLARIEQVPDLKKRVAITLPRMSFEMTGISYDSSRKSSTMQTFKALDQTNNELTKVFMPVPYNVNFRLSIMSKLNEDALQVVEQILPYFQPHFNLTVDLVSSIGEKRDIPMILERITMDDQYEGDFTTRRVLIYTLRFTAKTYLFGPSQTATKDIIKKSTISYITGDATSTPKREVVYASEPRAIKNYTGTVLTNLVKDITTEDILIEVNNASSISANTYLDLEGEEVYVRLKNGNVLTVDRGRDGTSITPHLTGAPVKSITTADNAAIEAGDDFGFSGSTL